MKITLAYAMTHGQGIERTFNCPVHDDQNPSARVNVLKGVWFCHACGARGNVKDIYYELSEEDVFKEFEKLDVEYEYYPESWMTLFTSGPVHPYWLGRFTEEACRHFQLGYDSGKDMLTYPVRDPGGRLLGVTHRNLDGGGSKYRYPKGVPMGQLLFNFTAERRDVVYLVEGAMDVVAAWEADVDAFAIYGSHLSMAQIRLLQRLDPRIVVVLFDNDRAGHEGAAEATEMLDHYYIPNIEARFNSRDDFKDLGELDVQGRKDLLDPIERYVTML
jgi:DNA primase